MAISRCEAARFTEAALSGALLLIPITFLFVFRDPFIVPKFLLAAAVSVAVLGSALAVGDLPVLRSALDVPIAGFFSVLCLSALFSVDGWLSWIGPDHSYLAALPGIALCLSGFYAGRVAAALGSNLLLDSLLVWILAGAVPVSMLALGEALWGMTVLGPDYDTARSIASFGAPTMLASYLAVVLPFAYRESFLKTGRRKWFGFFVGGITSAALFVTTSRAAGAAAVGGIAVAAWFSIAHSEKTSQRAGIAALIAILIGAGVMCISLRKGDRTRFSALGIAAQQWVDTPILGTGPGTFTLAFRRRASNEMLRFSQGVVSFPHAHNDWAEVLSSLGGIGMAAFAWLHWGAWRASAQALQRGKKEYRTAVSAVLGALTAILLFWKFNFPALWTCWLVALMAGIIFAPKRKMQIPVIATAAMVVSAAVFAFGFSIWNASADRLNVLGRRARAQGRPREAAAFFASAISRNPAKLAYRLDFLNTLWDAAGDNDIALAAAVASASDGVRLRPRESEMHRMLGLAQLRRGDVDRARTSLEAAVRLAPSMRQGLMDLTHVAALQGDTMRQDEIKKRLEGLGGVTNGS